MMHEYRYDDTPEKQWNDDHGCTFTVEVPIKLTIEVDGYDTEESEDLSDRIDCAIYDLCDVLYHDKRTKFFSNMERDYDKRIDIKEME